MHRTRTSIISFALLCLILASSSTVTAEAKWPFRRVRPLEPAVAALIARGAARRRRTIVADTLHHADIVRP